MDTEQHWWFCLKHNAVEPDAGCPAKDRLGPYSTREEAASALETVRRRNEEWERQDGDG
ncbi:MAG TPA: hypothetical protein VMU94_13400 [Streptosporangiaceae bacterium]|nr:hypothetical protein [Streptosporangiaceae bacterium]